MKMLTDLTAEALRHLLDYDQATGDFCWRVKSGSASPGKKAGCKRDDNYIVIRVCGRTYLAHRLAWLWVHGDWPLAEIDHIDMDPANNRLSNLRAATHAQNKGNLRAYSNNTTGFKGVCYAKRHKDRFKPWKSTIKIDGKTVNLGMFTTPEAAHAAYAVAATKFFGEFARAA